MDVIIAVGLIVYAAVGIAVGVAFVTYGITRVQPAPVTIGARALILPGAGYVSANRRSLAASRR